MDDQDRLNTCMVVITSCIIILVHWILHTTTQINTTQNLAEILPDFYCRYYNGS